MGNGPSLTISDSELAISFLMQGLEQREALNSHPLQVLISRGGNRLIRITLSVETGRAIGINTHSMLHFLGQLYPDRTVSFSDVQQNLKDVMAAMREEGVRQRVPWGWHTSLRRREIDIILTLEQAEPPEYPRFLYAELIQLMQLTKNFYSIHGNGAALLGGIYYGDESIGLLTIEAQPRPLALFLNETADSFGEGRATSRSLKRLDSMLFRRH